MKITVEKTAEQGRFRANFEGYGWLFSNANEQVNFETIEELNDAIAVLQWLRVEWAAVNMSEETEG